MEKAVENNGMQNQAVLYQMDALGGAQRVFLDPNKLSDDGTVALTDMSFSKDGRWFAYSAAASGSDWVEIRVIDNGPGIPPELHERIFEFNYSGARRSGKLGFGLWWVKTLIARFGGSIAVESDGRRGTTFILRLPIVQEQG